MKKEIFEAMNKNGFSLTEDDSLLDVVLTMMQYSNVIETLAERGIFIPEKRKPVEKETDESRVGGK